MGFIIAAAILVIVVLGILTAPWWRRPSDKDARPLSGEHLVAELGDDVATGLLAAEDLKPAARDLEMTAEGDGEPKPPPRPRWGWAAAALLAVPLAAGVLYVHFGDWRAALLGEHAASVHEAQQSLAALRAHLGEHPQDLQGWLDLGQGDEALGRYPAAAQAFARAAGLEKSPDADVLGLWGEALLLANPRQITPQEQRLFARVLKLDPDNARGLWYGGLIALATGDRAHAVTYWRRLLAQPNVPNDVAGVVRNHLKMLGAAGTVAAAAPAAARLKVTVRVTPALAAGVRHGETLYVFVRPPAGGPPLAVRRLAIAKLPVTIGLSDADAMLQGRDLSSVTGALEVVARLAPGGSADPRPGDLVGSRRIPSGVGSRTVTVVIDHRVR